MASQNLNQVRNQVWLSSSNSRFKIWCRCTTSIQTPMSQTLSIMHWSWWMTSLVVIKWTKMVWVSNSKLSNSNLSRWTSSSRWTLWTRCLVNSNNNSSRDPKVDSNQTSSTLLSSSNSSTSSRTWWAIWWVEEHLPSTWDSSSSSSHSGKLSSVRRHQFQIRTTSNSLKVSQAWEWDSRWIRISNPWTWIWIWWASNRWCRITTKVLETSSKLSQANSNNRTHTMVD